MIYAITFPFYVKSMAKPAQQFSDASFVFLKACLYFQTKKTAAIGQNWVALHVVTTDPKCDVPALNK